MAQYQHSVSQCQQGTFLGVYRKATLPCSVVLSSPTILKLKGSQRTAAVQLFLLARDSKGESAKIATAFLHVLFQDFCWISPVREETGNYDLGTDHMNAQNNKTRNRKEESLLNIYHKQQDMKVRDCRVCLGPDRSLWREGVGGDRNEIGEALTPYPSW